MKTPEQIRNQAENSTFNDSDAEYWLREIAAQLAELNLYLRDIKESIKRGIIYISPFSFFASYGERVFSPPSFWV